MRVVDVQCSTFDAQGAWKYDVGPAVGGISPFLPLCVGAAVRNDSGTRVHVRATDSRALQDPP
jgi:hypothetical protein